MEFGSILFAVSLRFITFVMKHSFLHHFQMVFQRPPGVLASAFARVINSGDYPVDSLSDRGGHPTIHHRNIDLHR